MSYRQQLLRFQMTYVRVSRFMPRVEIVHKHNTAARRLYIRGNNGKVCKYIFYSYLTLFNVIFLRCTHTSL